MLSSVSSISSQRRAAVMEVKGVSAAVWGNDACLPVEVNLLCAGIVVEDCLLLLLNLLKNNSSNQNFFKEGSYIQRMKPWFEVGDDNSGWSAQKVTNLHLMLQVKQNACVCRALGLNFGFKSRFCFTGRSSVLSVGTSHGVSSEFPRSYGQLSEVYVSVWSAAAALHHPHGHWSACWHPHWGNRSSTSVAVDCKRSHEAVDPDPTNVFRPSTLYRRSSEAHRSTRTTLLLSTLPRIRRGKAGRDPRDIKHSASIWCLISARRPAIVVLLMSMVNERQPFVLRCAVLYCFQCFLYKNQKGQGEIVATLLPSTIDGNFTLKWNYQQCADVSLSQSTQMKWPLTSIVFTIIPSSQQIPSQRGSCCAEASFQPTLCLTGAPP